MKPGRMRLAIIAIGLVIVAALVALRADDPYPVATARNTAFDLFQRLSPRPARPVPVTIVDIDEVSLARYGQWPWPRDLLARLTRRLVDLGAASIAFDMLFAEKDRLSPSSIAPAPAGASPLRDYDAEFAAALTAAPSVLGVGAAGARGQPPGNPKAGMVVSGDDPAGIVAAMPSAVLPIPALREAASGLGGVSLDARDGAGTVRRIPLLWSTGTVLYPSLALEALRVASGAGSIVVLTDTRGRGYIQQIRVGPVAIPTTAEGDLTLWYRHYRPEQSISAAALLGPDAAGLAARIAGHIVLVGTSAAGLLDLRGTAIGDNMPGVAIHAQALEQILAGQYLLRADWVAGLEIAVLAVLGIAVVLGTALLGPAAGLLMALASIGLVIGGAWIGFIRFHLLADPGFPAAGIFVVFATMAFLRYAATEADRRRIRQAFGHYVAPALLAEIERNRARLKLGGERRELTIIFADIRGFTPLGERLPPEALVGLLNTLFTALGAEITSRGGTIDKFIGDAVMAFWNAPLACPDHAARAAAAALAMRATVDRLNANGAFGPAAGRIGIGIGLATGEALVGNMGLETRFDYSCIGDSVNVAARLEAGTRAIGADILVSAETRAAAPHLAYLRAGALTLKGKSLPQEAYALVGDEAVAAEPGFMRLAEAHERLLAALGTGGPIAAKLADCHAAAAALSPRLTAFYEALAVRRQDFALAPAAAPPHLPSPMTTP